MLTLVKIINTLNNAVLLKKYKVVIKHFNTFSLNVLKLLQQLNIIDSYLVNDTFTTCTIFLNNATNNVFFKKILFIFLNPQNLLARHPVLHHLLQSLSPLFLSLPADHPLLLPSLAYRF